ncbi:MAG: hypothetical protein KDA89_03620 [Planctomycetaceae bacterium]|nr:hypothetical protein [Planctomycetaceae bacterium]
MTFASVNETSLPEWLRRFAHRAASAILDEDSHAPIGCHTHFNSVVQEWEVTVFLSATEVVGGALDGTIVPVPIQVDVTRILKLFDAVPQVHWQSDAVSDDDDLAQHLSFQGKVHKRGVWLRMLQRAPDGVRPGRLLFAETGETRDVWESG